MKKIIGKSGEAPRPQLNIPVTEENSVASNATATIIDLIAEGEIVGLVDGAKSIYLDETALQNEDGTFNFAKVNYRERVGTQGQSYMDGFSESESQTQLDLEITNALPITRSITDLNVNKVRANFYVPALQNINPSTGDVLGNHLAVSLEVSNNGGPFVEYSEIDTVGKSSNPFGFSLEAELPAPGPWEVRFKRNMPDDNTQYYQHKTFIQSYDEIILSKLRYPNTAYIGLNFDAQQFSSMPSRYYDVKLLIVKIPSNYDPETRAYDGVWDGTFINAWTDNPAWCFYDLITNSRYGCGIPESQVDKWTLYQIAQYCDEMVSDGFGGTEPRFTCNLLMNDRSDAYTIVQNMASIFRAMVYWSAGSVSVSQDSPQDASYLFTPANVVDGKFAYSGASAKARHTVALVAWNDPRDFYRSKIEYVEDQDAIARFGVNQIEMAAFGCTSRGQAHRLGKWLLYTEQYESETVTFQTGLEGVIGRPGQVVKIADPSRAGERMGGRISAATLGTVTIDQDPPAAQGFTLSVMLDDGTVEERIVSSQAGRVLTLSSNFSDTPSAQAIWMLSSTEIEAQTFRIISVREESGGIYTVSALKHNPEKFDAIESDINLHVFDYTNLRDVTAAPANITVTEALYQSVTEVKSKVIVSWDTVDRAGSYSVRWRVNNENFVEMPETQFTQVEILDAVPGTYTIYVSAINTIGKRSPAAYIVKETFGKTARPANVANFSLIPNNGQAYLTWDLATDLDVLVGGQVRIRHTPRTTAQAWKDTIDIIPSVPGTSTSAVAPLLEGTYMAKFVDSTGNYSEEETMIVTLNPQAIELNVVQTIEEATDFPGTKTNLIVDSDAEALALGSETLIDDFPLIDSVGSFDYSGDISLTGTYLFENTHDLGAVYPTRISSIVEVETFSIGYIWDTRTQSIDDWDDIDGADINDVNAILYVRTTLDNPGGSPTWTDWKRISAGAYVARAFQFKLEVTSEDETHNIYIKELTVTLDMEDRAVNLGPITSGVGVTYRVDYADPFYAAPSVSITASNLGTGEYFTITNQSATGFDIVFKNSGGTTVSRSFSLIAKGYGRLVA